LPHWRNNKRLFKKNKKHQNPTQPRTFSYLGQLTIHHLVPTSRGGGNNQENKKLIPRLRHDAWHLLFKNLKPEEVIEVVKEKTKEEITEGKKSRILAWEIVFGYWETTTQQRIEIIKKFWTKEG
jgi:hypothetical protein